MTGREGEQAESETGSDKIRKNVLLNLLKDFDPQHRPELSNASDFTSNHGKIEIETIS